MGLLLSRMHKLIQVRGGFWWCSFLIAILLVMPRLGGSEHMLMNGIYESIVIIVFFPLIVSMGAGSKVTDSRTMAVCKFFGEISYPIYIIHYPFVYIQMAWAHTHADAAASQHVMVNIGIYCLILMVAYAAYKLYDIPVRSWLKQKLFTITSK
jgi:peptidoglycan/LPS O-acetylase OafA/YrhL